MSQPGPYENLPLPDGTSVPLYLITFDKEGRLQSPLTLQALLARVDGGDFTDVHVFSHGWNNVFKDALQLYRGFFGNYFRLRHDRGLNNSTSYRPVAVGIIWPSTLLVAPWESTPKIAAIDPGQGDDEASADAAALASVADAIRPEDVSRLYELSERGATFNPAEAKEFANILLPVYQQAAGSPQTDADIANQPAAPAITAESLLALWQQMSPAPQTADQEPGFAPDDEESAPPPSQIMAASFLSWLDPRGPIRVASVLQMKDRAGVVGARGVGPNITQKLLQMQKARVHLIGHSYGAKVILSSLCYQPVASPAETLLLLEPAISYLCFSGEIDGHGLKGGYRDALNRVRHPIYSTFSSRDVPLRRLFHLAVIRQSDWGEQKIAALPPSKFAALGGFGPGGLASGESQTIVMPESGGAYPASSAVRVFGIDGSNGQIKGHGDVATPYTAWAHLTLVQNAQSNQVHS
jgi:hypothetical protein